MRNAIARRADAERLEAMLATVIVLFAFGQSRFVEGVAASGVSAGGFKG